MSRITLYDEEQMGVDSIRFTSIDSITLDEAHAVWKEYQKDPRSKMREYQSVVIWEMERDNGDKFHVATYISDSTLFIVSRPIREDGILPKEIRNLVFI